MAVSSDIDGSASVGNRRQGFVTQLIERMLLLVYRTSRTKSRYSDTIAPIITFDSISDFWREVRRWPTAEPPIQYIELEGALSGFAPALPSDPGRKRDLHRYLRRNYHAIKNKLTTHGDKEGPTTLDAFMAFSAGQMVVRLVPSSMPYIYMGLYHSIVRNAIPLFVDQKIYTNIIEPALRQNHGSNVIEARVVGRLLPISENFMLDFLKEVNLYDAFKEAPVDELAPKFGLQVDSTDMSTTITPQGRSRYLDGDIWVALREAETDRVVSRFVDLSDPSDVSAERRALKTEISHFFPAGKIISEYDGANRLFPGDHILNPATIRNREYFGLAEGVDEKRYSAEGPVLQVNIKELNMSKYGGITMSDEKINIHNIGGIVNVKTTLSNARQNIANASSAENKQHSELQNLIGELESILKQAEVENPEETARVAQTTELITAEMAKEKPSRSFLEITTQGLVDAAKALEGIVPPIAKVVKSIVGIVLA